MKTFPIVDLEVLFGPVSENYRKWKVKFVLRSCLRTKKNMEYASDSDTSYI